MTADCPHAETCRHYGEPPCWYVKAGKVHKCAEKAKRERDDVSESL